MRYYFLIRTMDDSRPDFKISVPATGEYEWISDTKIAYIDFYTLEEKIIDIEKEYRQVKALTVQNKQ